MLNHRRKRATSNLALLELAARRLGNLNENVVYLGGCATALFINDPFSLDVRATDQKILGFGNPWYKEALKHAVNHEISNGLFIKLINAPYFLATKFEAFKTRGNNDVLISHDYEDIISVIAGQMNIVEEVTLANLELRKKLKIEFTRLLENDQFEQTLPSHVNEGPATMQRVEVVIDRINKIINFNE